MPSINKTLLIISIILLSLLVENLKAGACCEGDKTCSGCWMCEGSDLRSCWDRATAMPSKCEAKTDLQEKAACYCLAYAAIAKCWGAGTCCTEYAPTLAAATDLCNLQTYPSDMISDWQLKAAVKEAARVADAIWHNDSGVDVPKCESHIKPYTGGAVATGTAKAPTYGSYQPIDSTPPPQSSQPSYTPPSKPKDTDYTKPKDGYTKPGYHKHYDSSAHKYHKQYNHDHKGSDQNKDGDNDGDCDGSGKHKQRKRASYTSIDMSAGELREARLSKRKVICGVDFHEVRYPGVVPPTVQKAYDQI